MTTNRKYKSDAFEAIHSSVSGMHRAGTIDKKTMREFDEACLTVPGTMEPAQIKSIREAQQVSQPVFVRYLNTSESTVEKWETGAKRPSGMGDQAASDCAEAWIEDACLGAGAGGWSLTGWIRRAVPLSARG